MSYFYPQAICTLRVRWESLDSKTNDKLDKIAKITCLAKSVSVTLNDYTEADIFNCEFDYQNFPFDPRCIRSLGITIHMDDRTKVFKGSELYTIEPLDISPILEEDKTDDKKKSNIVFMGFADEESIDLDETDRVVRIEGRDYTGLLLDLPWTGKVLDTSKPIGPLISEILKQNESTANIELFSKYSIDSSGSDLPVLKSFAPNLASMAGNKNSKKNKSTWDMIKNIVDAAALICYIEIDRLVITSPRNLYSGSKVYNFIYGKNIQSLSFSRKLGRQKGINILVRSINQKRANPVIKVEIPKEANSDWLKELNLPKNAAGNYEQVIKGLDKDGKPTEKAAPYLPFNIADIEKKENLILRGQNIWEEIGRQQIDGELKTKDMRYIGKDDEEFNMLKIRNGTPVEIAIDQGDMKGLEGESSIPKKTQFLIERGYDRDVANAFATTFKKFGTKFYTKSVEFTINKDDGFSMSLEFLNFIEITKKGQ